MAAWAICQLNKYNTLSLVQSLAILEAIRDDISMDFIEGLPKSHGFDSILVVLDHLSKYRHFPLFRRLFIAKQVAEEILNKRLNYMDSLEA